MAYVKIIEDQPIITKKIENTSLGNTSFISSNRISVIESNLPFRVRFTAIQIPATGVLNTPPIPLQIIGFSNYIL